MRRPDSLSLLWLPVAFTAVAALAETQPPLVTHMSEELRELNTRIVILPTAGESGESVTGTYGEQTAGLHGGIAKGAEIGQVPVEVGHVPVNIPIPILRELGMLFGGVKGGVQRQMQEMRDRMTEDLSKAVEQPLSNAALATDVYWGVRNDSSVDPKLFAVTTPIPQDTDAILYISLNEITLNIQKDEAIISTSATGRLQRYSDGKTLYRKEVTYSDRDKLKIWAQDDYVLWTEYSVFARHYIARELSAELYERIDLHHSLVPARSDSIRPDKKNDWHGETKTLMPTLVWDFELLGDDANAADGVNVLWDVEIYDARRPVYAAKQVSGMQHTVTVPLEACKTYHWTVRPTYNRVDGKKNGRWMRSSSGNAQATGLEGRAISAAHAYIQDFPSFEVHCKAR